MTKLKAEVETKESKHSYPHKHSTDYNVLC